MGRWRKIEREVRDSLGEGTLWSARDTAVYRVDILAPALNRLLPVSPRISNGPSRPQQQRINAGISIAAMISGFPRAPYMAARGRVERLFLN